MRRIDDALAIFNQPNTLALRHFWDEWIASHDLERTLAAGVVPAYISANRWVADCPVCNNGMGVARDEPLTVCLLCGATYQVTMPSDYQRAEVILVRRPWPYRNWLPHRGETIETLERENTEYGVD